jgi:low density lipoprotein receptor-related protein 5/6
MCNGISRFVLAAVLCVTRSAFAGLTLSIVPVGGGSLSGGEQTTLEVYVQSDVDILLAAGQVDLPCLIDNGAGSLTVNDLFVGTPSLGGVPWLCPGGLAATNTTGCYAAQLHPLGNPTCELLPAGEIRYFLSITYDVSACVAGDFSIQFESWTNPPVSGNATRFRDPSNNLVPIIAANGVVLSAGSEGVGSCCDGTSCLADGTYAACCAQNHPGAQFFLGKSCGEPDPCRGPCCLANGDCADLNGVECQAQGGTSQSAATACASPQPCCLGDDACAVLDPVCCLAAGGTPLDAGASCGTPMVCCRPAPPRQMYWTESGATPGRVVSAGLDGSQPNNVAVGSFLRGISVDVAAERLYWGAGTFVKSSNLDGSGAIELVNTGSGSPRFLALDGPGGKIYWTDGLLGKITRANLDGSGVEDVISGLGVPMGIALDANGGTLYWADDQNRKIQRASVDGSNVQDLVTGRLGRPAGLALDLSAGAMYWAEGGTVDAPPGIYRANLDGTGIVTVATPAASPFGIALDTVGGKMYWAAGGIYRANLDGSGVETLTTQVNLPVGLALALPVRYGDVDENGYIDVGDVLCVVGGFSNPANCLLGDISPCGGDGTRDVGDVLVILDLFAYSK